MKELLQALNNYLQLIKPYFAAAAGIIYEAWKSSGIVGKLGFVVIGATVLFIFCKLLSLPFRKKSGKKKRKRKAFQKMSEPSHSQIQKLQLSRLLQK